MVWSWDHRAHTGHRATDEGGKEKATEATTQANLPAVDDRANPQTVQQRRLSPIAIGIAENFKCARAPLVVGPRAVRSAPVSFVR
jgi:hypothetical protein